MKHTATQPAAGEAAHTPEVITSYARLGAEYGFKFVGHCRVDGQLVLTSYGETADEAVSKALTAYRACNSHAALVAALSEMERLATNELWNTGVFKPEFGTAVQQARAALNAAKEGQ